VIHKDSPVLFFTSPRCDRCAAVRTFLISRDVAYVERDVTVDARALRELIWLTGRASVPAIVSGESAVIGFDPDRMTELLFGDPDAALTDDEYEAD
jgi:glutaredoxin